MTREKVRKYRMKKNRSMIAALALLAVVCVGYAGVSFGVAQSEKRKEEEEAAAIIYVTDLGEVTGMSITRGGETMSFEKQDGEWVDADDPERPLKQSLVALLASAGQQLTASRELEGAGELVNYGLDEPAYRGTFSDDEGNQAVILVGDQLEDGRYYAKLEAGETVYTIDSGLVSAMDYSNLEFTQSEILPAVDAGEVCEMRITGSGEETVYSLEDETLTDEMAEAVADLVLGDCAAWKAAEEELAEMGFDGSQLTLSYSYVPETDEDEDSEEALTVVLEIGSLNEAETDYYVRQAGSQMILRMTTSSLEELLPE